MQLRLKVVKGKPRGHCLSFPKGEFMFGRGPECDVRPNSDLVSRQHCLLLVTDDSATIRDLGSMNGTLVNGQLVTAARTLRQGDTLSVGPLVLGVQIESCPETVAGLADTVQTKMDKTASEEPSSSEIPVKQIIRAQAQG